ncbi:MAG: type VI secretion system ATPase TssH [Pseudomonadota bacterium]
MLDVTNEVILGKLNRVCYEMLIRARRQARSDGNAAVELAHWLFHFVQNDECDVALTLDGLKVDRGRVMRDIQEAISRYPRQRAANPAFAESIFEAFREAWYLGTLMFGETQVRSGHILVGALRSRSAGRIITNLSPLLANLSSDDVVREHRSLWRQSAEETLGPIDGSSLASDAPAAQAGEERRGSGTIDRFTQDLSAEAQSGKLDPIVGRDLEIRQIVDVLMRRRQNNPILTGEAGVGKTAVVEGFAQQVVAGNVPEALKGVRVLALDLGLLQAGASMKGEFEQRLRTLIDEVQASETPIILFIDEAHTLIGAGGQAGTGDAANLLKPALARGTLRTIAATTWSEYRQYFEKDPALTRRFQPVNVDEPDEARCADMLRGLVAPMEKHHGVRIADEGIVSAVHLSKRYIPARQLPDKAVSLLDTACARVAISQATRPAALADVEAALAGAEREEKALSNDETLGIESIQRREELADEIASLTAKRDALLEDWSSEQELVGKVLELREAAGDDGNKPALGDALKALNEIDPDRRQIRAHVDAEAVASVVSDWTGIPVGRMVQSEVEMVLSLSDHLAERVIGQSHGLKAIAKRVETSRAKLDNPNKPIGVFMLCGPSGVGKTETALAIAEQLYGGEQNVITINMSEFQEAHTVSALKGAPPGYVGYGEGGRLTEAVRRKPFSVVLLDEVEKAHPDVHEVFFQVFDKGVMEDGTGRVIDFKNTLIILTSNVGTDLINSLSRDPFYRDNPDELVGQLQEELVKVFPPALLGRMVVIPYFPLSDDVMAGIVRLHLGRVIRTVKANQGAAFEYDEALVHHVVERCSDPSAGGRMIDRIITNSILPTISREFLQRSLNEEVVERIRVTAHGAKIHYAFNDEPLPEPPPEPAIDATAPPPPGTDGQVDAEKAEGSGEDAGVDGSADDQVSADTEPAPPDPPKS